MRRPVKRVLLSVGAVFAVAVVGSLATGPGGSTWDRYAAVGDGMTEAEVAAVLGPPEASNSGPVNFCVAMP